MTDRSRIPISAAPRETANDRFKRRSGPAFVSSIIAAAVLHFAVFALFPTMSVADDGPDPVPIQLLPEIRNWVPPEPPQPIEKPAFPIATDLDLDVTIDRTVPNVEQPLPIAPPLTVQTEERPPAEKFVPFSIPPRLLNGGDIERMLQRRYPPLLRDAGVSAKVQLLIHIDEAGRPLDARIHVSSAYDAFDRTALEVSAAMKFSPAQNRDRAVAVWIVVPVSFAVR
jgi:protein TonB